MSGFLLIPPISNSLLATMADQTFKGNVAGSTTTPVDLTIAQAITALRGDTSTSSANILRSKGSSPTRSMTASSGSVAYTGIGFKPSALLAIGVILNTNSMAWALFDSGGGSGFGASIYSSAGATNGAGFTIYEADGTAAKYQGATVASYDSDGFTLAWTKGGSPSALTASLYILALR